MKQKRRQKRAVAGKISEFGMVKFRRGVAGRSRLIQEPDLKSALTPAQEAHEITFVLQGFLKRSRLQFLVIAAKLADFKKRKMYQYLQFKTIEDYAESLLGLGRASLYRYLQIYEWVREKHPKWLLPKPEGFIPDFYDCVDLMWIEHELDRTNLTPALEAALKALQAKALAGKLKKGDVDPYRKRTKPDSDGVKALLRVLRRARIQANKLRNIPSSVIGNLDAAIETLATL